MPWRVLYAVGTMNGLLACGGITQFAGSSPEIVGTLAASPTSSATAPKLLRARIRRVEVTADHIVINEKIQFDLNLATIRAESGSLLDEIAKTFTDNPQIKKVEIQGHASGEGDQNTNLKLSEGRARAVMAALIERKVPASTLVAKGYGSKRKMVDEKTEADREQNRRVEFLILDPPPPPGPSAPSGASAAPAAAPSALVAPSASPSTPTTGKK